MYVYLFVLPFGEVWVVYPFFYFMTVMVLHLIPLRVYYEHSFV